MLKLIGTKVAKVIDAVEQRTKQAGVGLRTNLCCPVVAQSNEKYLARVLAARQVDLDVCLEDLVDLKANVRLLTQFVLAMLVCFTFVLLILWAKNRRSRQQFEVQLRHRDVLIKELHDRCRLQNVGSARHQKSESQTLHLTPPGRSCLGHELETYAEEIEHCLQQ
mmetsp:Transcript_4457/g.12556  ORF Transcript_4457/g.12556 Transcript_4457/m.12556 type:complete len:165 (+) Transcript_4457:276-770(+)